MFTISAIGFRKSSAGLVWLLRRGSPVVARLGQEHGEHDWASALVVKTLREEGKVMLLADNGDEVEVPAEEVRQRDGEWHPVNLSREEGKKRAFRFTAHAAQNAQRFIRALLARKEARTRRAAAVRVQSAWRAQSWV